MNNTTNQLQLLEKILEAMLIDNADITARGVVRQQGSPFRHASDITRSTERRRLVESYRERQRKLRALMERADGLSRTNLTSRIAKLEDAISIAEAERDVLIASHKAMLLAVGEMGGMVAWRKFFEHWVAATENLQRMKALPSTEVCPLPEQQAQTPSDAG